MSFITKYRMIRRKLFLLGVVANHIYSLKLRNCFPMYCVPLMTPRWIISCIVKRIKLNSGLYGRSIYIFAILMRFISSQNTYFLITLINLSLCNILTLRFTLLPQLIQNFEINYKAKDPRIISKKYIEIDLKLKKEK